jgi:dTMP kinase
MADTPTPINVEVNEEERMLLAALKAVQDKKARLLQEAEEKQRAEEKRKTEEADEAKQKAEKAAEEKRKAVEAEEKCKADEAETLRLEKAEKEKAAQAQAEKEEAEKIQTANEALRVGVAAHMENLKRTAKESGARVKAQALATRQKNLAKIGLRPEDPLMLVPKGPGPSRQEVQQIRKQVAGLGRKRKLGDTGASVRFSRSFWHRTS